MNILIIGSGAMEHALAWKLRQSRLTDKILCVPGSMAMMELGERVCLNPLDTRGVCRMAAEESVDLCIAAHAANALPLLADALREQGIRVFGPGTGGAALESSTFFARNFARKYSVPCPAFELFDNPAAAKAHVISMDSFPGRLVIRTDSPAPKGVRIVNSREEALETIHYFMERLALGKAGSRISIEELPPGRRMRLTALMDGRDMQELPAYREYFGPDCRQPEEFFEEGMGALAPAEPAGGILEKALSEILDRTLEGLRAEKISYRGALTFDIAAGEGEARLLSYRAGFASPGLQALLLLLKSDLAELLCAAASGRLAPGGAQWEKGYSACAVMASLGYPSSFQTGKTITGLESVTSGDAVVFHSGTDISRGRWITAGGKVFSVAARGENKKEVLEKVYGTVRKIGYDGRIFREDIGK
ncbi:MAG: phosphoribosylglycinamide synthetase C domain-containing protein [bacterium]